MTNEIQTIPFAELTTADLGSRDTVRENAKRMGDVIRIPLSNIVERAGFNVRIEMGDIEGLSFSLENNGQHEAGKVDVLADGKFALVEGHRRYRAWLMVWDRTGDEPYFTAVVNSTKTTEADRLFQMFTTQDSKPLEPHEVAELIQRLINMGYKQADISTKIGKTPAYVSQMLSFAAESPSVKLAVSEGHTTVSEVLKAKKAIPVQSERTAAIGAKVNDKKAAGSTKTIKAADIAPTVGGTKRKQRADKVFNAIRQNLAVTEISSEAWETMYQDIYQNI
jgi:predicted transcriptional regulator